MKDFAVKIVTVFVLVFNSFWFGWFWASTRIYKKQMLGEQIKYIEGLIKYEVEQIVSQEQALP